MRAGSLRSRTRFVWSQRRDIVEAGLLLAKCGIQIRRSGVAATRQTFRRQRADEEVVHRESTPDQLARVVERIARRSGGLIVCIQRSIVLEHLLESAGVECEFHIGAKRTDSDSFAFHAWVTVDGRPLADNTVEDLRTYVEFDSGSLPGSTSKS